MYYILPFVKLKLADSMMVTAVFVIIVLTISFRSLSYIGISGCSRGIKVISQLLMERTSFMQDAQKDCAMALCNLTLAGNVHKMVNDGCVECLCTLVALYVQIDSPGP